LVDLLKTNPIGFYWRGQKVLTLKFILNALVIISVVLIGLIPVFAETEISDKVVVLHTKSGDMVIELFPRDAPKTVENFLNLTSTKFYDQTIFHRIIKDFMIQGGDPKTKPGAYQKLVEWGTGDAGYTIPGEFNTIKHVRGIVSMARGTDPDSASSQFFIVDKENPALDLNYAAFGRLATNSSFTTLDKIVNLENPGIASNYVPYQIDLAEIVKAEVRNRTEIPDLLNQDEPERVKPDPTQVARKYSNQDLGFSFVVPAGWFLQEPQKETPESPDVVAVGNKIGGFTPAISISVKNSNGTSLAEYSSNIKKTLQKAIEANILTILSEEKTTVNDNEALVTNAIGKFNMTGGALKVKFREVIIRGDQKFYIFTYTNSENNFDATLPKFNNVLNSLEITSQSSNDKGGGCLIATAAFDTEIAPQVQLLREIRERVLETHSGTDFMNTFNNVYYLFSPSIADLERQNPAFKEMVKIAITPMLSSLSILNYVEINSEQEILVYGIGLVILNIGMYFVAPALLIIKIKNSRNLL
jgi:peptidyl-prolyl cis-trans isomerase B (cyclophilin B)